MPAPEGFTISSEGTVPEGFSIVRPPEEEEDSRLNFAQRFGNDISERLEMLKEIGTAFAQGEQTTTESALQVAGKVSAGAVLDLIGETLVSGVRGLDAITPEMIKDPVKNTVTSAFHEFLNTDAGRNGLIAARGSMGSWNLFKQQNPRAARNIEATVNIGMLMAPSARAKPVATTPSVLQRGSQRLATAATEQDAASAARFIDDLIRPKQTQAVRTEQVGRTAEQGILRNKEVALSSAEQAVSSEVRAVPGISQSQSLQGNYNVISQEVSRLADDLMVRLEASPARISHSEVSKSLELARTRLEGSFTMTGDASRSASNLISEANRIVMSNPQTSAGLLRSRQAFDSFVRSQKPKVLDPALENATTMAVREVRQTMNTLIDIKNPIAGVRQSLRSQSNLFRAMDNIAPKAAQEGSNALLRGWQNMSRLFPIKGEFNQTMATIFGIGGLGAAATFAPFFTKLAGLALGTVAAGKFVMSAEVKRGVSAMLKNIDDGLRIATNPEMIRQLRVDRATIIEMVDSVDE